MKIILVILKFQKLPFWPFEDEQLRLRNFWEVLTFLMWNFSKIQRIQNYWNGSFWLSEISQNWFHVKSEWQKNCWISKLAAQVCNSIRNQGVLIEHSAIVFIAQVKYYLQTWRTFHFKKWFKDHYSLKLFEPRGCKTHVNSIPCRPQYCYEYLEQQSPKLKILMNPFPKSRCQGRAEKKTNTFALHSVKIAGIYSCHFLAKIPWNQRV